MAYKDMLVYLDPTVEAVERIRFAVSLAKTHGARLIGVDVSAPPAGQEAETEAAVSRTFTDTTRESGVTTIFAPADRSGEIDAFTHCADLMIAPGPESLAHGAVRRGALDRALLESGAPMLMLPPDWTPGPVGDNIVIAWNAGREALRAVHDAMPLEKVRKVLKIAKEPISLETPIGDEEDSHLGDFIEDKNAVLPIDAAIQSNLRETTTRVLASLTPREERVLRMRFGIGMNTDHTLEEVGQQFSVTRERIRQIEAKALRKLKHPSRSRKLRSFLDN